MKKQKSKTDFRFLMVFGFIILVVGLASISRNSDFGSAMIIGGFILSLISFMKMSKNKKVQKAMASAWWFLAGAAIFGFAGIRYFAAHNTNGGIINSIVALLFLAAFISHSRRKK